MVLIVRGIMYHKLHNPYILIESTNITKINQIEQEQKSQTQLKSLNDIF